MLRSGLVCYNNLMSKLWFKNKTYGYGWVPASWEGWVILIIYIVLLTGFIINFDSNGVVPAVILTIILLLICYKKGETLEWRWKNKK